MRKKSKYKPKGVNPQAHLMAVRGIALFDTHSKASELTPIEDAVQAVATHTAEKRHWIVLQHAINLIEQLVVDKVLQDNAGWLKDVQDVVRDLVAQKRACRYNELALIREVPEYYTVILDNLSYAQYENAKDALAKRKASIVRSPDGKELWILVTPGGQ